MVSCKIWQVTTYTHIYKAILNVNEAWEQSLRNSQLCILSKALSIKRELPEGDFLVSLLYCSVNNIDVKVVLKL